MSDAARILLVEGDAARAAARRSALEAAGCSIEVVPTPVAVLRYLQGEPFDLMVCNTALQRERDGAKMVCVLLQERKVSALPPILILSDDADPSVIKACVQAGVVDYVLERGDLAAAVQRIQKALDKHRGLAERLVRVAAAFLGPATRVFLDKVTRSRIDREGLAALRQEQLPELFHVLHDAAQPILKGRVVELLRRLEEAFGVKSKAS